MDHSPGFLKVVNETRPRIQEISPEQALARLQDNPQIILLDVREDNEWLAGHASKARHLGRGVLERDIEKMLPDADAEIIMYCGGGYRSALACDIAQRMGYKKVASLAGGYKSNGPGRLDDRPVKPCFEMASVSPIVFMATTPPPLPAAKKDPRLASVLNLSIPGVGLIYLGQRKLGAALALTFMACFVTAIGMFLIAYARYLSLAMSDHILEGDNIEKAGQAFPRAWLAGLALAASAIYLASTILLRAAKRRLALVPPAR